jgi:hypothetical protein
MGGPGERTPPGRGFGGCAPKNLKGERVAPISNLAHEWGPKRWRTLSLRGWAKGVEGAQAPSQGVWGMCPQNFQRRSEQPTLATPLRVGP